MFMKQFLPLMILLVFVSAVNAQTSQLIFNENFETYSNGNLNPQGSWSGSNTNRAQVTNTPTTPAFSYPGYANGSKYVTLTRGSGSRSDPSRNFTTSVNSNTATTFFMSFLVRVPSASATQNTDDARPTVALLNSAGSNVASFYIADNGNGANYLKFGIRKDELGDGSYASANYTFGNTYLIVIRYDLRTSGNDNDRMYMWVNPSLASEPSIATASRSITESANADDGVVMSSFAGLQLFQEDNSATASLDAFRVSYARGFGNNPAAAWDALNPSAAPLPVTFGEIKGYNKDAGVQLDWTVHTELNVSHYEIERSGDGVSFNKIGSLTAQAQDGVLYYTYYDAMASAGVNFYRVRNVDLDGKYSYSPIVKINAGKNASAGMSVFPNPVSNNRVNLQSGNLAKGEYKIEVYSAAGQQLVKKSISHSGGVAIHSVQLPAGTTAGIYTIRVTGNEVISVNKFLVQ
jgi:hypothetical protein